MGNPEYCFATLTTSGCGWLVGILSPFFILRYCNRKLFLQNIICQQISSKNIRTSCSLIILLQTKCAVSSSPVKSNLNSQIVSLTFINNALWIADDKNFVYIWDTMVCNCGIPVVFVLVRTLTRQKLTAYILGKILLI